MYQRNNSTENHMHIQKFLSINGFCLFQLQGLKDIQKYLSINILKLKKSSKFRHIIIYCVLLNLKTYNMVKISAVIITYNEERNIERCIDSLIDIADEILVVDSFSTDTTAAICKRLKVKFIQHKFEGHIQQKNWAITQSTHPYILSVDADEIVSEKLKNSIVKAKNNWLTDGYTLNRMTSYCGKWIKHGGWYPDKKLRLWDSRKGEWTGTNPHDRFEMQDNCKISHLKGDLLHYSYHSLKDHTDQVEKFTDITAKALYEKGKKSSFVQLYVGSSIKFLRNYFFKLGFLDGYPGFRIAKISAYATFLKYAKLKEMHQINNFGK